jgi:kynureninase
MPVKSKMVDFNDTLAFAQAADAADPLRPFRDRFFFPQHNGQNAIYLCGNSLGLQPKSTRGALLAELDHWAEHGVEGHFRGDKPWMYYHKFLKTQGARVVGALPEEVVVMNTLTVNLHLMMVSFYKPTPQRFRIVMEAGAFPSDQYAMETQARFHGFDPLDAIVEIAPREGEETLRNEDIIATIERYGDTVAVVMFGGVNYYTGQYYDLESIADAAHRVGAYAGFDLAHAAGNVPVRLHDWGADFAVWCSYKYLNSGPGGPGGVFVHERHAADPSLPRFAGWWGHDEEERFQMRKGFKPMYGADGWQLSNAQIFASAAHLASLAIFEEAGIDRLREKSVHLTAYLEYLLKKADPEGKLFKIITPSDPQQRGCQLSLLMLHDGRSIFDHLSSNGVIADWREPNVIRFAPVPLYNSFEDVYRVSQLVPSL